MNNLFKVGFSKDIHNKIEGDFIWLGGIKHKSDFSIDAYSDGDIVLHSICEALMGALGIGDLGKYFNSKTCEKKFSSIKIANFVKEQINSNNYVINNIDCMIQVDNFKLSNVSKDITYNIAKIFEIDEKSINIKATTSENNFIKFIECSTIVSIKGK